MMPPPSASELVSMKGCDIYTLEGDKIGRLQDFYYDPDTGRPEWLTVESGLFRKQHQLVPLEGAHVIADRIIIPYSKDAVKATPDIRDEELTLDEETELFEHYGLRQAMERAGRMRRWEERV